MTNTKKIRIYGFFILLACLLAVGTVSAYEADPACASLMQVLNGTPRLTAIELVHTHTDGLSFGTFKLWTEYAVSPKEDMSRTLRSLIESDGEDGNYLKWIILTTVSGSSRISYVLSPDTSTFERLPIPVDFPSSTEIPSSPSGAVPYYSYFNTARNIDEQVQGYLSRTGAAAALTQVTRNRYENVSALFATGTEGSMVNYFSGRESLRSNVPVTGRFRNTLPSRQSNKISKPSR